MFRGIDTVRRLWAGDAPAKAGDGREIPVEIFPKPVQPELPIWLATGGNPETFVEAGKIGANVLTALLLLDVEELGDRIKLFRRSLSQQDHDPGRGKVTVMLHTFIGDDLEAVRQTVKGPFLDYLGHTSTCSDQWPPPGTFGWEKAICPRTIARPFFLIRSIATSTRAPSAGQQARAAP